MSYVIDEVPDIFWFGGREYLKKSIKQKDRKLRCALILNALLVVTCDSFEEYEKIENMLILSDQLIRNGYALIPDLAIKMVDIIKSKIDDDLKELEEIIDTAVTYYPFSEKFWRMYSNYDVINLSKLTFNLRNFCNDEDSKIDPFTKMIIEKLKGKNYLNITEFWLKFFSGDESDTELDDPESFWSNFYEGWIVSVFFEEAYFKRGKESFFYYGPFECLSDEEIYDMFVEKGFKGTQQEMEEMFRDEKKETEDYRRCYNEIYDDYYEEIKSDYSDTHYSFFWSWRWGEHSHTPRMYSYYVDSEGVEDDPDLDVVGRLSNFADEDRLYKASDYKESGKYAKAEALLKRSLEFKKRTLGPDNPLIINSLNKLAEIYILQKEYDKAESLYKRSLEIKEWELGRKKDLESANIMEKLAELYKAQGEYSEAEKLFKQSLEIKKTKLGLDHPEIADIQEKLAELYEAQRNYSEADSLFERFLEIKQKSLDLWDDEVVDALKRLAETYNTKGEYSKAGELYKKVFELREKVLIEEHIDIPTDLNRLALFYHNRQDYAKAESLFKRSLKIKENSLDLGDSEVVDFLKKLSELYNIKGEYSKAEELYKTVIELREKTMSERDIGISNGLNSLALSCHKRKDYAKAESLFKRSFEIN